MTAASTPRRPATLPSLLLIVAVLCWAGNFVLGRAVHGDIPPLTLTFWRWLVATLVLLPFALGPLWASRSVLVGHWRLIATLAATGVVLFHVLVYAALRSTPATNASLIMATLPVVVPIVSLLLDGIRIGRAEALGIALSLLGVAVIVVRGDPAALFSFRPAPGDALMLLAVPIWALYTVLLRRLPPGLPPLATLLAIAALGVAMLAPAYLWELATTGGIAASGTNVLAILYVGVFASVISYICWNRGVIAVGATRAGQFIHLMPVFATLLALVLLGEALRPFHAVGIALIAAGIVSAQGMARPGRVKERC
ncbi:MAG: DMT family transporter [Rhodospirillales bacterium]